jgi:hypothetical protein
VCHMTCPSHPASFDQQNNMWPNVHIRKLLTMQLSPVPWQFLPPKSQYSPQRTTGTPLNTPSKVENTEWGGTYTLLQVESDSEKCSSRCSKNGLCDNNQHFVRTIRNTVRSGILIIF